MHVTITQVTKCNLFESSHHIPKESCAFFTWMLKAFALPAQDPPPLAKQSAEETVPSVVEVLSEDEDKPPEASVLLLLPVDRRPTGRQQLDGSPGTDGFPDYVTLSTDFLIQSPKENPYIYECETGGRMAKAESCRERSDFVNRSYVPVAEPADTSDFKSAAGEVSGNLYSNLARS